MKSIEKLGRELQPRAKENPRLSGLLRPHMLYLVALVLYCVVRG